MGWPAVVRVSGRPPARLAGFPGGGWAANTTAGRGPRVKPTGGWALMQQALLMFLAKGGGLMKYVISVGQTYQHEDGDEYEVVRKTKDSVTFETSSDSIVHMDLDELATDLQEGVLLPIVYEDAEEGGDDEDEED